MQAAIKDVKGKFEEKMQLAITRYLPGGYRLQTDPCASGQAATVWWHHD
jgi:hypothetical protein